MQDDLRTDQVRAVVGTARMRAVAVDALGGVDLAAAIGGGLVHHVLVGGTRQIRGVTSAAGADWSARRRRTELPGQVVQDGREFRIGTLGAAGDHRIDALLPLRAGTTLRSYGLHRMAAAADL
jgi:hypothetical protein